MAYVVSLLLIGLSGLLLDMHRRAWQAAQQDRKLGERDLRFARAQYRRRTQASAIIGAVGAVIALWPLVPMEPWPLMIYAASLGGACLCLFLLAGLDAGPRGKTSPGSAASSSPRRSSWRENSASGAGK